MRRRIVGAWLVAMALVTLSRSATWQAGERALWQEAVAHSPAHPRPWINLGTQYARMGAYGMAEDAFRWASELSRRSLQAPDERRRGWAIAETNVALMELKRGAITDARNRVRTVAERTSYATPRRVLTWIERGGSRASLSSF